MISTMPPLVVTFGRPGSGKTYVARYMTEMGYTFHDGDDDLPEVMRLRINASQPIADDLRDEFFGRIEESTARLIHEHPNVVIAQTFIKEKYRRHFLDRFPAAQFILVETDDTIRRWRLAQRSNQPLAPEYVRKMDSLFEAPLIPHWRILNNEQGDTHLRQQFANLFSDGRV